MTILRKHDRKNLSNSWRIRTCFVIQNFGCFINKTGTGKAIFIVTEVGIVRITSKYENSGIKVQLGTQIGAIDWIPVGKSGY